MKAINYIKRKTSDILFYSFITSAVLLGAAQTILTIASMNPNPPIYKDVNGDGVQDKVIQEKVWRPGAFGTKFSALEEKTLYGIKVDNKTLYLPKEQFEEYQK